MSKHRSSYDKRNHAKIKDALKGAIYFKLKEKHVKGGIESFHSDYELGLIADAAASGVLLCDKVDIILKEMRRRWK